MKKLVALIAAATLSISSFAVVNAEDDIKVVLDGKAIEFDVPPQIVDDRTLVPFRAIFEALGYMVSWNQATQTVSGVKNDAALTMVIGSTEAKITTVEEQVVTAPVEIPEPEETAEPEDVTEDPDMVLDPDMIEDPYMMDDSDMMADPEMMEDPEDSETSSEPEPMMVGVTKTVTFDVPPQIIDDRTMVPVRAVGEMSGYIVDWIGETRTVTIVSPAGSNPAEEEPEATAAPEEIAEPEETEAPEDTENTEDTEVPEDIDIPEDIDDLPITFDDGKEILANHTRNFELLTAQKNGAGKYDITFTLETFMESSDSVEVWYNCLNANGKVVDTFGGSYATMAYTWTEHSGEATISGDTVKIVLAN